jgi:hypothetical protein
MRTLVTAAAMSLFAIGAAHAQTGRAADNGPPPSLPKIFQAAGYSQPDITPGLCQNLSPTKTQCTIPQMTAGDYLIQASGTSTAASDGAVQAIDIRLGNAECNRGQSKNTGEGSKPWTSGPQTIRIACVIQVVSDDALTITTNYTDEKATKDPRGPTLSLRRLPWNPYLSAAGAGGATDQPKAAAK